MRRWMTRFTKRRPTVPVVRLPLASVLAQCAGNWVAVDRATNQLRAAAVTADALAVEIRRQGLTGVAVMRAPDPTEPELVGLG